MKQKQESLIEQVAKISAETATITAIEYIEKLKQEEQKIKRDRRLRNTKLLLRNYRTFVLHCEGLKMELQSREAGELLEDLEADEFAVESIKRSKERTLAMVQFINQMLQVYQLICKQSNKEEDMRKYETINKLYIQEEKMTAEEVAECHKTNVRTVYRDVNDAVKTLSILIFGVDGIRLVG